ncbi:ribosomal protein S7 domain-containing protein [Lipomyces doorenjongii]
MYSARRTGMARILLSTRAGMSRRCVYSRIMHLMVSNLTSNASFKSLNRRTTLLRHIRISQPVRFFTSTHAGRNSESNDERLKKPPTSTATMEEQSPEVEQGTQVGEILARDTEAVESGPVIMKEEDGPLNGAVLQGQEHPSEKPVERQYTKEGIEQTEDLPIAKAEQQGNPVGEIIKRDSKAIEKAPEIVKEEVNETAPKAPWRESEMIAANKDSEEGPLEQAKSSKPESGKEPVLAGLASHLINLRFSGLSLEEYIQRTGAEELSLIRDDVLAKKQALAEVATEAANRKSPKEPFAHDPHWQAVQARKAKEFVLPGSEDPVVSHLVNLIMRDGKKQRAQRIVAEAFVIVRMRLQNDPVKVLRHVVEKTMPLVKIKKVKSGAKSFSVPKALTARQRHRKALDWILEEAEKRPSPSFGVRLGDALVAVRHAVDTGAALEKKNAIHKIAIENRAYINARS